jgi:hypothetical protein
MYYAPNADKSGRIESELTAGSYVIYDDERYRVARTNGELVEVYQQSETSQIVESDEVVPLTGGAGEW